MVKNSRKSDKKTQGECFENMWFYMKYNVHVYSEIS
jgi:hypothetical protein